MAHLRLRYTIGEFDPWRQMFDADPLDRAGSGVRRVLVTRGVDAADLLFVDLEFDTVEAAWDMLVRFQELWAGIPGNAGLRRWVWLLRRAGGVGEGLRVRG